MASRDFSDLQKVYRQRLIEGEAAVRDRVSVSATDTAPDVEQLLTSALEAQRGALDSLEKTFDRSSLEQAVRILRSARHIYIAGLRRSRPIADYLHYGFLRSERACSLLDFAGGMAAPQIATMEREDVLIAIAFPPYSNPVVDAVMDAHVSGKVVLAITDSADSPLSRYSNTALLLEADATSRLQPIGAAITLAQILIMAVT
ncbi:MurR/RpiR family transcriptional regulator [Roseibium salinum]|nr:MurR/RpiR family transcriptional regulator [Roseibium salinum]